MVQGEEALKAWRSGVTDLLRGRGQQDGAIRSLMAFEAAMFQFHRRFAKGELLALTLRRIGLGLEPAGFQALSVVARIQYGVGLDEPRPATIGLIAEEMSLDPSRASRIVSDLVASGHVRRAAAQDDGRKSVIELTGTGRQALYDMRDAKWDILLKVFDGWAEEDLASLSSLLTRYIDASEAVMQALSGQDE